MILIARVFSKIFNKSGIILVDHKGHKYICGNPNKTKPITLKLLKKNLNWKLILNPDLEFPEAYIKQDLVIENASLSEFLNLVFNNIGRKELTVPAYITKFFLHSWRRLSNIIFQENQKKTYNIIMILEE